MADLRFGQYGKYYGSLYNESVALTEAEKELNAHYIYSYLSAKGWTLNAIAGILGNMEHESALNPGRWEGNKVGVGPGYGLVQWTKYTKYTNWCTENGLSDPSEMDNNLARIIYEMENGLQYYKKHYPYTFKQFAVSTDSPYTLACAFAFDYERSWTVLYGTESQKEALRKKRGGSAEKWYTFLSGEEPTPPVNPVGPGKKKKGLSLLMMYMATKRKV